MMSHRPSTWPALARVGAVAFEMFVPSQAGNKGMKHVLAAFVMSAGLFGSAPAFATGGTPWVNDEAWDAASSSTTSSGIATLVMVGATVYTVWFRGDQQERERERERILRENVHAVWEGVTTGAGPVIEDIAWLSYVPREQYAAFGRELRKRRSELLAFAPSGGVTPERARKFFAIIDQIAASLPPT